MHETGASPWSGRHALAPSGRDFVQWSLVWYNLRGTWTEYKLHRWRYGFLSNDAQPTRSELILLYVCKQE